VAGGCASSRRARYRDFEDEDSTPTHFSKERTVEVLHARCAGLDVHKAHVRPARTLPCALVGARFVAIAPAALSSQLSIARPTTRAPAHPLRRPRRSGHREHLPALGTSTTHPPERPIAPATLDRRPRPGR
jgi:hypothetical protein